MMKETSKWFGVILVIVCFGLLAYRWLHSECLETKWDKQLNRIERKLNKLVEEGKNYDIEEEV